MLFLKYFQNYCVSSQPPGPCCSLEACSIRWFSTSLDLAVIRASCASICRKQRGTWFSHPNPGAVEKRSKNTKIWRYHHKGVARVDYSLFGWKLQFWWFLKLQTEAIFWFFHPSTSWFPRRHETPFSSRSLSSHFQRNQIRKKNNSLPSNGRCSDFTAI